MSKAQLPRRTLLRSFGLAAGSLLVSPWEGFVPWVAQNDCSQISGKRIRWIVPNALGGGYDTDSRLIEPFLEKTLGVEIVIENVPGASGIVGARSIKEARPNGRTIGILNGAGLLAAFLAGEKRAPNPMKDFTILARVARTRHIWAASSRSVFQSMEDVFREAKRRSLIFATRGVGSLSFVNLTLTSHLLGIPVEVVAGYSGSRGDILAALRGEVDLVAHSFESILGHIENGDIKPLLQVSDEPIARHPALKETSVLGGPDGLATKRAHDLGREVLEVRADVTVLSALIGAGRLIVAPPGMEEGRCTCLKEALHRTLTADAFQAAMAAANRSLDIAPAETVEAEFRSISQRVEKFIPVIQDSIRKARR